MDELAQWLRGETNRENITRTQDLGYVIINEVKTLKSVFEIFLFSIVTHSNGDKQVERSLPLNGRTVFDDIFLF